MAREHPQGTLVLVLGICAWVLCGLCAPFAWVMGSNALKEIDANPTAYSNRSAVQAGRILGMVYSILVLVGLALLAVLVVIGMIAGAGSSA
jgi:phosphotransferase system  glucose/maltose/N-acetylglucosamine-specific IIC component